MASRTSIGDDRLPYYPIRVFRVEVGTSWYVRMLSERYGGLLTHWVAKEKRSYYCPGPDCPLHKLPATWKGYTAAECWDNAGQRWLPVALELTESMELDLRAVYSRGQVWGLSRGLKTKKGAPPVASKLLETVPLNKLPPEFDFLPVLLHLYHVTELNIQTANPMPARPMLEPSIGDGPTCLKPVKAEKSMTAGELADFRAKIHDQMNKRPGANAPPS